MDDTRMQEVLANSKNIAIIGLSAKEERPSNMVARYLLDARYTIFPVNPGKSEILGCRCYSSLADIEKEVDIVNIFRKSADTPPLVEQAAGLVPVPKCIWLQLGITSSDSAEIAKNSGIPIVMDKCIKIEHQRLCSNCI